MNLITFAFFFHTADSEIPVQSDCTTTHRNIHPGLLILLKENSSYKEPTHFAFRYENEERKLGGKKLEKGGGGGGGSGGIRVFWRRWA
jgi:hypothetical protein